MTFSRTSSHTRAPEREEAVERGAVEDRREPGHRAQVEHVVLVADDAVAVDDAVGQVVEPEAGGQLELHRDLDDAAVDGW